ncbi:hypothetical protein BHM03_00018272 [Ensete ventricosum]|nr:hypothetical protein BHM03_00018272 [Ensete ventricosum]
MGRQLGWETWREYTEESKEAGRGGRREEDVEGVSIVSTTNLRIIRELLFGRPQILEVKIFEVETAPTHLHVCREHVLTSVNDLALEGLDLKISSDLSFHISGTSGA